MLAAAAVVLVQFKWVGFLAQHQ